MELGLILVASLWVVCINRVCQGGPCWCCQDQSVHRCALPFMTLTYGLIYHLSGLWTHKITLLVTIVNHPTIQLVVLRIYQPLKVTPTCCIFWSKKSHQLEKSSYVGMEYHLWSDYHYLQPLWRLIISWSSDRKIACGVTMDWVLYCSCIVFSYGMFPGQIYGQMSRKVWMYFRKGNFVRENGFTCDWDVVEYSALSR